MRFKYKTYLFQVLILVIAFASVPIALLLLGNSSILKSFLQEHPKIGLLDLFNSITDYLSLGITLFLGAIVYQQSQKINDLESSQYDIFIGTDRLDYSLAPLSDVLVDNAAEGSDFSIKQGVSGEITSFFTHLKTNFPSKQRQMFLPLSFVTKNQPLIVSLKFSKISLVIIEKSGRTSTQQNFSNRAEPIHVILENDTRFFFGISFLLPDSMSVGQILLQLHIDAADQLGRITPLDISITLQSVDKRLYLLSTQTKRAA